MARVLIAAGGTGGHLYPALALAVSLRERGHEVSFVGGDRLETTLVPQAGFTLHAIPMRGLSRTAPLRAPATAVTFLRSVSAARRLMQQSSPDVIVGMGGYASLSPVLARPHGTRVVLHEQNARLTLAHTLSLRRATVLALSLPLEGGPPRRRNLKVALVGNPLRAPVRTLAEAAPAARAEHRAAARRRLSLQEGPMTVLVTGGSQGALALNRAVPDALGRWSGTGRIQVLHLTGPAHVEESRDRWRGIDVHASCHGYLEAMEDALAVADLVVSRSGASTVCELHALGLPSVLVPLPSGGFQAANARVSASLGASRVVEQEAAGFPARLGDAVAALVDDASVRQKAAVAAAEAGKPQAADALADVVEESL